MEDIVIAPKTEACRACRTPETVYCALDLCPECQGLAGAVYERMLDRAMRQGSPLSRQGNYVVVR